MKRMSILMIEYMFEMNSVLRDFELVLVLVMVFVCAVQQIKCFDH